MMKKIFRGPLTPFERILVPVDFSDQSLAALRRAVLIAGGDVSKLCVLHVAEPLHMDWRADTAAIRSEAHRILRQVLAKFVNAEFGDAGPKTRFIPGKPVDAIVKHAATMKADLIVLGTQGRTGLPHAQIGSVAERVVRHAPCPVLVVR
jgi:universal stress protein A